MLAYISTFRGIALQIYPESVDPRSPNGLKNMSEYILNAGAVRGLGMYEDSKDIDVTYQNC